MFLSHRVNSNQLFVYISLEWGVFSDSVTSVASSIRSIRMNLNVLIYFEYDFDYDYDFSNSSYQFIQIPMQREYKQMAKCVIKMLNDMKYRAY